MQAVHLVPTGMIAVKSVSVQMVEPVQWMGHAFAPQELLDTTAQSKVLRNALMPIFINVQLAHIFIFTTKTAARFLLQ